MLHAASSRGDSTWQAACPCHVIYGVQRCKHETLGTSSARLHQLQSGCHTCMPGWQSLIHCWGADTLFLALQFNASVLPSQAIDGIVVPTPSLVVWGADIVVRCVRVVKALCKGPPLLIAIIVQCCCGGTPVPLLRVGVLPAVQDLVSETETELIGIVRSAGVGRHWASRCFQQCMHQPPSTSAGSHTAGQHAHAQLMQADSHVPQHVPAQA